MLRYFHFVFFFLSRFCCCLAKNQNKREERVARLGGGGCCGIRKRKTDLTKSTEMDNNYSSIYYDCGEILQEGISVSPILTPLSQYLIYQIFFDTESNFCAGSGSFYCWCGCIDE